MSDISIYRGKNRAYLYAGTSAGLAWMEATFEAKDRINNVVGFNSDVLEDMIKEIEGADLSYENR